MKQLAQHTFTLFLGLTIATSTNVVAQDAAVAEKSVGRPVAVFDKDVPGIGPIRTEDWFQKVWRDRRATFAKHKADDRHALVFFGDSITQGWSDDFRGKFPNLKVANRGISGDTTRG